MPHIRVSIVDGPVPVGDARVGGGDAIGAGAVVRFEGVVREMEDGRPLVALEYEAYDPMASSELQRLAETVASEFGVIGVDVIHSKGRVGVGEVSFRLTVAAAHRREAIDASDAFIERMKRDIPIWKRPVWRDGATTSG